MHRVRHLVTLLMNTPSTSDGSVASPPSSPSRSRFSAGQLELRAFHVSTIVHDATVAFCGRFLDPAASAADGMLEAAGTARHSLAECSRPPAMGCQAQLRLLEVARARLDELLIDFEAFLREGGFRRWSKDDADALAVRSVAREAQGKPVEARAYALWLCDREPAVIANAILCLIHQINYLVDQKIRELEKALAQERGAVAPAASRPHRHPDQPAPRVGPTCPACGRPMVVRTARHGAHAGSRFWGCLGYPDCKNTLPFRPSDPPMAGPSEGSDESA